MRLTSVAASVLILFIGVAASGERAWPNVMRHASARASCDADDLCDLEGYTIVSCTHATGEFDGADVGKAVSLDNGMIFTFESLSVDVAVEPPAVVFARRLEYQGRQLVVYKLLINDQLYDVERVR